MGGSSSLISVPGLGSFWAGAVIFASALTSLVFEALVVLFEPLLIEGYELLVWAWY